VGDRGSQDGEAVTAQIWHRTFRLSETVDHYHQRSCHAKYSNNDTGHCKAAHLTALMWRRRHIKNMGKPPVSLESINGKPGAQKREASPDNDVHVP